jgi:sulfur relay protein TusB/DsrH
MENKYEIDLGFIITKPPLESSLGSGFLDLAQQGIDTGKKVGLFLISDGVWFAKINKKNTYAKKMLSLINQGVDVTVSEDNLQAAGIQNHELLKGVVITDKPYDDLVNLVMEKWGRVMVI